MSHELRTPLNSILILSNSLAADKKGNLDEKQTEHAQVINSAGNDLLNLINGILDLSKVEEGKMEVIVDSVELSDVGAYMIQNFNHQASEKELAFDYQC